jgi:flagellar protein FliO/FliZ
MLLNFLQAIFALAVTLGLIGGAAYAVRRWAPAGLLQLQMKAQTARRMQVIESLHLDPQHRLVLVRLDRQEKLILLGEGRLYSPADTTQTVSS